MQRRVWPCDFGIHGRGVLELLKKLHLYRDVQRTGQVVRPRAGALGVELDGAGARPRRHRWGICEACESAGSRVIGVRRTGTDKPDFVDELIHTDKLDEYLPQADCVASRAGHDATKGMFDAERWRR